MNQILTINNKYYKYLAQLFSQSVLTALCQLEQPELLRYVLQRSGYAGTVRRGISVGEFFEGLYDFLLGNYRCEYVYKNALANQILLDRHTPEISTLLTEFRADDCKADVVILNGTSSVYEIKTELDSFDRLERQLKAYRKVFDKVYVVTHESQVAKVEQLTDRQIGLIHLTEANTFTTVREADSNRNNIDPQAVFSCLRQNEYCQLVLREYGYVPDVPNTRIYRECRDLAIQLNPATVHDAMVEILKKRSSAVKAQTALEKVPYSLRLLYLVRKFTKKQHSNFFTALNCELTID
jgi:hypothetical protein